MCMGKNEVQSPSVKCHIIMYLSNMHSTRVRPRFFDQVGHETMYASSGNKHFFTNLVIVRLTKIMNRADKNWAQF